MSSELASLIERRRKAQRLTISAIAEQVGVSYPAAHQWTSGKTKPTRDKVEKLAAVLRVNPEDIYRILDKEDARRELLRPRSAEEEKIYAPIDAKYSQWRREADERGVDHHKYIENQQELEIFNKFMADRDWDRLEKKGFDDTTKVVPVIGTNSWQDIGDYDFSFELNVNDYIDRPKGLSYAKNAYAFYVPSNGMSPKFEVGELLFVNPDRIPAIGDFVVIETVERNKFSGNLCYLKKYIGQGHEFVLSSQFNPIREVRVPISQIKSLQRIVPMRELLGV